MNKGLVIINTGNGKGKTTAAIGMILRAVGHNLRSEIIQFIKASETGEIVALNDLAPHLVTTHISGCGFTWDSEDISKDTKAAQEG